MATTYAIDGTPTTRGPATIQWRQIQVGTDHERRPIYSQYWEVDLSFPQGSITDHKEWTDIVDGGSHTLDVLGRDELGFRTLSPVSVRYTSRPVVSATISGPFVLTITGAIDNS